MDSLYNVVCIFIYDKDKRAILYCRLTEATLDKIEY